jgi:uncharacterized protein (UPF0303 family)
MAIAEDIAKIIDQERGLVFAEFDEQVAYAVAMIVRDRAASERLPVVCDVRRWDRPLIYFAMPGTNGDHPIWALRKSNTVRRLLKSSYRAVLEQGRSDEAFAEDRAMPAADYALSGGSFPISVSGAGVIGAVTVSGLHQRDDHELVVAALCSHLGVENTSMSLPRIAA